MYENTVKNWYPGNGYEYEVAHVYIDGEYDHTENTGRVRNENGQMMTFDILMSRMAQEAREIIAQNETEKLMQRLRAA